MQRLSGRAIAGAVGITGIVLAAMWWTAPASQAGPCTVLRRDSIPELHEASGLAISRRHPGILWSHNDSGNAAELFAVDAVTGRVRARVRVPVTTRDWEDVSAGPCPAGTCLYIADIGDNGRRRGDVKIYRVPEPALTDTETAAPDVFTAVYADGPRNAESLFLAGTDLFIVTRDAVGGLYRSPLPTTPGARLTFEQIGALHLVASDAEATPDEASVVVRTMHAVAIYRTADLIKGGTNPPGFHFPIDQLKEPQGEGVALDANGVLHLASEGRPWNRAGRLITLQCTFQ